MALTYRWSDVRKDLAAGLTVAAIAVPQAMAYSLIAGIDPRFGLYSAVVVTAIASVFGSSSHLINGPTNAISLVVFSALAVVGPETRSAAFQATFLLAAMVGLIQILIAVLKLGDLTRYISESVILGFMTGAGFLIALTQVGNLLGLEDRGTGYQHILVRLWLTVTSGGTINPRSVVVSLTTVILVLGLRRLSRKYRLPRLDMLMALVVVAVLAATLGWSHPGVDGKPAVAVVGDIPAGLPAPHVPEFKVLWVRQMAPSALAIACLGLLEALAISKSIAHRTREPLDYNRQCLAEGLANLGGSFFQCLPGSGSLTRSAINFQAGAVSRWSGVFAAGGGGHRHRPVRSVGALHSQAGVGGNPPGDRGRVDRLATAALRPARFALRRRSGVGHRPGRRLRERRAFHLDRGGPVDRHVRPSRLPDHSQRIDRRRRSVPP